MNDFYYSVKTDLFFGTGKIDEIGTIVKKRSYENVVVFHGKSAEENRILGRVCRALKNEKVNFIKMSRGGGYTGNPTLSNAEQLIEKLKQFNMDFELLLAIGGGSVIDLTKAVAIGMKSDKPVWDFFEGKSKVTDAIPIGVVLTNPASGSESSVSTVLTNTDIHVKRGCSSELILPVFAVLDPATLLSLPKNQIACATADIIMHTLERYLCCESNENEMTDAIAESLISNVIKNGQQAFAGTNELHPLSELMWCGSLSNNGITGLGRNIEFPLHQIGHQISVIYNIPHAETLTSIWNAWAGYYAGIKPERFARLGSRLYQMNINDKKSVQASSLIKLYLYGQG